MKYFNIVTFLIVSCFIVGCTSNDDIDLLCNQDSQELSTRVASLAPTPYVKQTGDVFAKKNLPTSMSVQMSNTCVTSIMEYANNKVFGGNTNEGSYILYYMQTYGKNVVTDGVSLENIVPFVSHFFNVSSFKTYTGAISAKHVVMTDIPSSIASSRHNILVLGYQPDEALIYMDPEKGCWYTVAESYISKDYNIELTGIKN
ncbi:MAG: hypothetical protein NC453_22900 [Muribaculum sp.]|nr:hypothetical protein [Muribaculum sp.]